MSVFLALLAGVSLGQQQYPVAITEGAKAYSTEIRGTMQPGLTKAEFSVSVADKQVPLTSALVDLVHGTYNLHLSEPLPLSGDVTVTLTDPKSTAKRRIIGIPSITTSAISTATQEIKIQSSTGADGVELLTYDGAGKEQARYSATLCKDPVTWSVKSPSLVAGYTIAAREIGGDPGSPVSVGEAPEASVLITGVEGILGGDEVVVTFAPFSRKKAPAVIVGTANLKGVAETLDPATHLELARRTLTPEEMASGRAVISVTNGVTCKDYVSFPLCQVEVELGGTKYHQVPSVDPIRIDRLRGGDVVITGQASPHLKRVRVVVSGSWASAAAAERGKAELKSFAELQNKSFGNSGIGALGIQALAMRAQVHAITFATGFDGGQAVSVKPSMILCSPDDGTQNDLTLEVDASGKFTGTLPSPLNTGDCVTAFPSLIRVKDDSDLTAIAAKPSIAESVMLDWGRFRGYFTLGTGISQYRNRFQQADTFVGFTADSRLIGSIINKCYSGDQKASQNRIGNQPLRRQDSKNSNGKQSRCDQMDLNDSGVRKLVLRDFRVSLNLFTDARASFRVASTGSSTTTPSTGGTSVAGGTAASTTTAATLPTQINYSADQPGYFLGALYVPISFKGLDWEVKGRPYTFFIGPIVRFGVETRDSDLIVSRNILIDPTKQPDSSSAYTIKAEEKRGGALPMYGSGLRLGIHQYELLGTKLVQRQVTHDLIGYFDITYGRQQSLRSYTFTPGYGADGKQTSLAITSDVKPMWMAEGRLKIPHLPALFGVDLAFRPNARSDEPNQLRFVLAFRIDAQKALAKVFTTDPRK